ncbi:TetR/AcrR family transcriptional regulator [Sphingomonas sp. PAMC 26617]|uniref:TetR/AcrR family transcriptional regulator n=1 Tax=Sphingomonas sp. PAMC 26617 TaxID=1112216 RepID=UPI0002898285|nr:TetR/AcrR family transcriptional regulator [Sphingomonas sp. PAMC 26617]
MTIASSIAAEPRVRGRKPTFDRTEALAIALDLFWRRGYEGVSISDLCQAIGIAAPSLYHAFGSKAELYREVVRLYNASNLTPKDIAATPSAQVAAQTILERGVLAVTRPDRPVGCMISSGLLMVGLDNIGLAAELRVLRGDLRGALEDRIARDVKEGVLSAAVAPPTLARFYATVLQGLSVQAVDGATQAELDAVVLTALRAWPK